MVINAVEQAVHSSPIHVALKCSLNLPYRPDASRNEQAQYVRREVKTKD